MARYARINAKVRADWMDDDSPLIPGIEADTNEPVETGLLWPDGDPVMRMPNPIGFGRDEEW